MSQLAAKLARGEDAFARGDLGRARELLSECSEDPQASLGERLQALNDLAVIAATEQRPQDAQQLLLSALADDPAYLPALENLGEWCAKEGDLVQASHWFARAIALARSEDARRLRARLDAMLAERRRGSERSPAPEPVRGPDRGRPIAAGRQGGRVLIVVDWFFPAVGGTERLAEAVGLALQAEGLTVEVAARRLAERSGPEHRGMKIHELEGDYPAELRVLVEDRDYDALLAIGGALCWPVLAALRLPFPRPRIVVVPCVNAANYAELHANPEILPALAQLAAQADAVGYSSLSGYDIRLWEELGVPGVYLPNAVDRIPAAATPPTDRTRRDGPLLLHVANFWPEKDHAGLLRALREDSGEWRLALIGGPSPDRPQIAEQVARLASEDPRVQLLGPASPEMVAAAMDEANVLLLPSLAEATPLVLLEAMSRNLPWIATPTCGAAHDHAGGLILPLALFGEGIDFLANDADAARRLGGAGEAHWRACYNWDVIGPRYARIVRGQAPGELTAPADALADTDALRSCFYDGRPARATSRQLAATLGP